MTFVLGCKCTNIKESICLQRPSELVNGTVRGMDNTQSCFYKFASQFGWTAADSCGTPNAYSIEQKGAFVERVNILKRAQPFWDPRTSVVFLLQRPYFSVCVPLLFL